jgi:hypothetical protein
MDVEVDVAVGVSVNNGVGVSVGRLAGKGFWTAGRLVAGALGALQPTMNRINAQ